MKAGRGIIVTEGTDQFGFLHQMLEPYIHAEAGLTAVRSINFAVSVDFSGVNWKSLALD